LIIKFYCKYAGGAEVDPAFMPCLMEYWDCPIYVQWTKGKEKEEKKKRILREINELLNY